MMAPRNKKDKKRAHFPLTTWGIQKTESDEPMPFDLASFPMQPKRKGHKSLFPNRHKTPYKQREGKLERKKKKKLKPSTPLMKQ